MKYEKYQIPQNENKYRIKFQRTNFIENVQSINDIYITLRIKDKVIIINGSLEYEFPFIDLIVFQKKIISFFIFFYFDFLFKK